MEYVLVLLILWFEPRLFVHEQEYRTLQSCESDIIYYQMRSDFVTLYARCVPLRG
jgi:hypothetical protein